MKEPEFHKDLQFPRHANAAHGVIASPLLGEFRLGSQKLGRPVESTPYEILAKPKRRRLYAHSSLDVARAERVHSNA